MNNLSFKLISIAGLGIASIMLAAYACWEPGWGSITTLGVFLSTTVLFAIYQFVPKKAEFSIPTLFAFKDYQHSIIIRNIDKISCRYEFSTFPDSSIEISFSDAAKGIVAANSTLILKVSDLVAIQGASQVPSFLTIFPDSVNVQVISKIKNIQTNSFSETELFKK